MLAARAALGGSKGFVQAYGKSSIMSKEFISLSAGAGAGAGATAAEVLGTTTTVRRRNESNFDPNHFASVSHSDVN